MSIPIPQLDGEPALWYDRLIHYYLPLGAGRSVYAAYKEYRLEQDGIECDSCSPGWYDAAKQYNWEGRARAYFDKEVTEWFANIENIRQEIKQERIEGLLLQLRKAKRGLELKQDEGLEKETTAALSQANKTAVRELREELDGYSSKQVTQLDIIIKELPESLQAMLIKALS